MKRSGFMLFCIGVFTVSGFADIPGPNKRPRPTPPTVIANTKAPDPTPAPGPKPEVVREAQMTIALSSWSEQPTLVITKAMVDKINAAARDKGIETAGTVSSSGTFSTQTIVGGFLLSLAFVFGGVWLARSKGQVSKPAVGVMLLAIFGATATLVIGNVPPPKRIGLTSNILNEQVMKSQVAAGKVKIMIVDYDTKDDISLIIPRQPAAGEAEE